MMDLVHASMQDLRHLEREIMDQMADPRTNSRKLAELRREYRHVYFEIESRTIENPELRRRAFARSNANISPRSI